MATMLYQPKITYQMHSLLEPVKMQQVIRSLGEQYETILVPQIKMNESWMKGGEKEDVAVMNGTVAITQGNSPHSFTEKQVIGVRWLDRHLKQANLVIDESKEKATLLSLSNPKVRRSYHREGQWIVVDFTVKTKGFIRVQKQKMTLTALANKAETIIEKEIRETFDTSNKQGVDIYNLKLGCYRQKMKPSDLIKLGNIDVRVIIETGMLKR
ncbi:Ger(x)C family spore germination C-terminal domain-containing protein [Paenibacillus sp. D51F]